MKPIAFLAGLLFYGSFGFAQSQVSISHLDGIKVSTAFIEKKINHILDTGHVTGLQLVIIENNQIAYQHSFGLKDVAKQAPLNDSTEMYAASLTKPVSAYITLSLVDKGVIDLDKPIHLYLKQPIGSYEKWKDLAADTASFNKITLRMLLSHSSGLPVLRGMYHDKVNLIAKPGEKFYYSNEGMNLLGFVIEEYTGKKLDMLAREFVFDPLNMPHSGMLWQPAFERNYSLAYFEDGKVYGSERRTSTRAAGSMTTTATDYAHFVIQLMQRKGLNADLYAQMLKPQIHITSKKGFGPERDSTTHMYDGIQLAWGLGAGLFQSTVGPAIFHTGHGDANQNYFVAYPDKGIAIVLLSNSANFEHTAKEILKVCIGDSYSPLKWLSY